MASAEPDDQPTLPIVATPSVADTFPLMPLPPELRNNVYEHIAADSVFRSRQDESLTHHLPLGLTHRKIREQYFAILATQEYHIFPIAYSFSLRHIFKFFEKASGSQEKSTEPVAFQISPHSKLFINLDFPNVPVVGRGWKVKGTPHPFFTIGVEKTYRIVTKCYMHCFGVPLVSASLSLAQRVCRYITDFRKLAARAPGPVAQESGKNLAVLVECGFKEIRRRERSGEPDQIWGPRDLELSKSGAEWKRDKGVTGSDEGSNGDSDEASDDDEQGSRANGAAPVL